MRGSFFRITIVCVSLVVGTEGLVVAQPSLPTCGSSGGPEICVRFDNFGNAPLEGFQFVFTFDANGTPSVEFLLGDNGLGTLLAWRVWAKDSQNQPAPIGSITAFGADDYEVRILDEKDTDGASSVGLIDLDPSNAGKFSRLTGGGISGDLTGNLFLQKSSGGTGGDITANFSIGGDVAGNIDVDQIHKAPLSIGGDLSGDVTVRSKIFGGKFQVVGNVTSTSVIDIGGLDANGAKGMLMLQFNDGADPFLYEFAGDLILRDGIKPGVLVEIGGVLASSASVDLQGQDIGGRMQLYGGSGDILNGGAILGEAIVWVVYFTRSYVAVLVASENESTRTVPCKAPCPLSGDPQGSAPLRVAAQRARVPHSSRHPCEPRTSVLAGARED